LPIYVGEYMQLIGAELRHILPWGRQYVKPNQSEKRQKFRELAESRTNRAIEAILRIGNLSNRQIYEWDEAEVKKVIRALREAVTSVESRFESPKGKLAGGFKL
jgi:hypothetical protein